MIPTRRRRPAFSRARLAGPTLDAARALVGARLVQEDGERRVGRIVEVEAYIGVEDQACHARFGRTVRNAVMFGRPGRAYVYLVYGMYDCLNIVTEPEGRPAAVLVRAVEPTEGDEAMRTARLELVRTRRRAGAGADALAAERERLARLPVARLASGPGLVAAAFGIGRADTGRDLCDPASMLRLEPAPAGEAAPAIVQTPRIGIAYAGEPWASMPWRFVIARHPSASGPRRLR